MKKKLNTRLQIMFFVFIFKRLRCKNHWFENMITKNNITSYAFFNLLKIINLKNDIMLNFKKQNNS